jgi:hypothetical protein
MTPAEVRYRLPHAKFRPYIGYVVKLEPPVDGMTTVEFAFPDVDLDPPREMSRIYEIRVSATGTAAGGAALTRASSVLGAPSRRGCSVLPGTARDDTYVWENGREEVVLKITASHSRASSPASELYFLSATGDWTRVAPGFTSTPCSSPSDSPAVSRAN